MNSKLSSLIVFIGSIIVIALSYFAGVFTTSFNTNLCYSEAINSIKNKTIKAKSQNEIKELKLILENLPLHGYESNCNEILQAIKKT